LSTDAKAGDEVVSRLKLDVRALTLLYESDAELRPVVEKAFLESQDDYMMRFTAMLQRRRSTDGGGNIPVALGEIVLASFLTIVGLAAFVPVMAGFSSPQQWLDYYASVLARSVTSGPLSFGVTILDFLFAALLLLGAFYSLRRASINLKRAGLVVDSSGH
jgi:hypothetical protein